MKGVLVEHDSATREMSHVEVVREGRVLMVFDRFLDGDRVPFSRNVFFNGTFSASSRAACLLKQTVAPVVVETVFRFRGRKPWVVGTTENRFGTS